jgi:hypothetical protein
MVTPAAERQAVAHLMEHHEMSERRACKAIGCGTVRNFVCGAGLTITL